VAATKQIPTLMLIFVWQETSMNEAASKLLAFLSSFLFNIEDIGDIFLYNISWLSPDTTWRNIFHVSYSVFGCLWSWIWTLLSRHELHLHNLQCSKTQTKFSYSNTHVPCITYQQSLSKDSKDKRESSWRPLNKVAFDMNKLCRNQISWQNLI
jgi:hypothetical protein